MQVCNRCCLLKQILLIHQQRRKDFLLLLVPIHLICYLLMQVQALPFHWLIDLGILLHLQPFFVLFLKPENTARLKEDRIVIKTIFQKTVISSKSDKIMPLTNNVIIKLNEITTVVEDKSNLKEQEIEEIKSIFRDILKSGERYDVDDIESWFENEGSWSNKASRIRVINLSHYIQAKYEQTARLKIISDD